MKHNFPKLILIIFIGSSLTACINSDENTSTGNKLNSSKSSNHINSSFMNYRNLIAKKSVDVGSLATRHNEAKTIEVSNSMGTHKVILSRETALAKGTISIKVGSSKNHILATVTLKNGKVLKEKIK